MGQLILRRASLCKTLVGMVLAGAGLAAFSATFYVAPSGCSDGNAGTNPTLPLCTPQRAYALSSSGDTITVTPGTYPNTSTLNLAKSNQTWQRSVTTGYATLDCGGTASYGINITAPGVTVDGFKVINQKRAIDGQFTFWAIFASAPAYGVTIKNNYLDVPMGLTCTEVPRPNPLTNCTHFLDGCISCMGAIGWQTGKFMVSGNIIHGGWSFGMEPGNTMHMYARCNSGSNIYGSCSSNADCPGSSCNLATPLQNTDPSDSGGTITENLFYFEGLDSPNESQLGILIETPGMWNKTGSTWLIYNNEFYRATRSGNRAWALYPREIAVKIRAWNNYAKNLGTCFYLQEAFGTCAQQNKSCAVEDQIYFNNTCDAGDTVNAGASAVFWGGCINAKFKNNLFKNVGYGIDFRGGPNSGGCNSSVVGDSTGGGPHDGNRIGAQDQIYNNLFYRVNNPNGHTNATYCAGSPTCTYFDINTSSPQGDGIGSYSQNLLTAGNPLLTAAGLLQAGSSAINAGTNNPLGTGTVSCNVTGVGIVSTTCCVSDGVRTINCALDRFGLARGPTWDVGWHEFGSTPPPTTANQTLRTGGPAAGVTF